MLDVESTRFLAFDDEQKTETGARALFEYVLDNYDSPDVVHAYVIANISTNAYLSSCGFAPYEDGIVECYYVIKPEYQRQGFAVEATQALIAALLPSVEVRAYCHSDNIAAHIVARNSNMTPLGLGRNNSSGLEGRYSLRERTDNQFTPENWFLAILT
jgi:ribosomal-protein-alanine N-acetyltransferase